MTDPKPFALGFPCANRKRALACSAAKELRCRAAAYGRRLSACADAWRMAPSPLRLRSDPPHRSAPLRLRSRFCSSRLALSASPGASAHAAVNRRKSSDDIAFRRLAGSRSQPWPASAKRLGDAPFRLAPHGPRSRNIHGWTLQPGTTLCIQSHPGFFALGEKRPSRCQGVANGRVLRCYAFLRIAQQPSACCRRRRKEPSYDR